MNIRPMASKPKATPAPQGAPAQSATPKNWQDVKINPEKGTFRYRDDSGQMVSLSGKAADMAFRRYVQETGGKGTDRATIHKWSQMRGEGGPKPKAGGGGGIEQKLQRYNELMTEARELKKEIDAARGEDGKSPEQAEQPSPRLARPQGAPGAPPQQAPAQGPQQGMAPQGGPPQAGPGRPPRAAPGRPPMAGPAGPPQGGSPMRQPPPQASPQEEMLRRRQGGRV